MSVGNEDVGSALPGGECGGVRLSPVEMRNLSLINDPALEGFSREGTRLPFGMASRVSDDERSVMEGASRADQRTPDDAARDGEPHVATFASGMWRYALRPDGGASIVSCDAEEAHLAIPGEIDGHVVVELAAEAFRGRADIESVALPAAIERIGKHAFDECASLGGVSLPASLKEIDDFAFAKSGLGAVEVPESVERIGAKAFFSCKRLRRCTLHDGLAELCEEAFAYSGLERIEVPASVRRIDLGVVDHTPAQRNVSAGSFVIDEGNPSYSVDSAGGLYRGDALVELIGRFDAYAVRPGTRVVENRAFYLNAFVRAVGVPEGVVRIGDEAFCGCRMLKRLELPDSLEEIGEAALVGTSLSRVRIGASLRKAGDSAFLVQGKSPTRAVRTLVDVEIDPRNERFYIESGLLCQRGAGEAGGDLCLLYVGPENVVRVPERVNRVAQCAFSGVSCIDELIVHGHLHSVCWEAFSTTCSIPLVRVRFPEPLDGYDELAFPVPELSPRFRSVTNLLTTDERGTVFNFDYYDSWVAHTVVVEEFAAAALLRLERPVALSARTKELYEGIFKRRACKISRYFAEKGDIDALSALAHRGLLDERSVAEALEEVTRCGDTQAVACLLELRRRFFGVAKIDFSL